MKGSVLAFVILSSAALSAQTPPAAPSAPAQQQQARPAGAQGESQNVQLLKGLSRPELVRAMQFMAASLGVSCNFCHVQGADGHLDFVADDKEEKQAARGMIKLVMSTNSTFFNNRPQVSCNTCHRGSPNPVSVPVLPIAAPMQQPEHDHPTPAATGTAAGATARPATPTRNDIVTRYAQALGNVNQSALNSIELKGTRETAQGNTPLDVMMSNGQTRIVATTPQGEMVNVIGTSSGWVRDQRGTREMPPIQYAMTRQMMDALRPVAPSDIPSDARVSHDRVADRDANVISYADANGNRHRLYFDAQSGLLVRHTMLIASPIGYIPQQTDFGDYRDVGGFKVPFVVTFESVDRNADRTMRYTEIHPNATIDPSVFQQRK